MLGFLDRGVGRHRDDVRRRELSGRGRGEVAVARHGADHDVAIGQHADELALSHDAERADVAIVHQPRALRDRRRLVDHHRVRCHELLDGHSHRSVSAYPAEPQDTPQSDLLREVDELARLLDETLLRQEGPELVELVARVRRTIRTDREATAALLAELDPPTAARLARAFTTYFYLANVAEQVHRGRELHAIRIRRGTWLSQAVDRIAAAGTGAAELADDIRDLGAATGVHRASDGGRAAQRALEDARDRRAAGGVGGRPARRGRRRDPPRAPPAAGARRPPVADRRAAPHPPGRDRRGAQRDVLLRRAAPRRGPGHARGADRRARAARRGAAARRAPARVRHVDRRRPRRQSERHRRDDARRARAPARPRDPQRARPRRRAAARPVLLGPDLRRHGRARGRRWRPTWSASASSTRATGGSTRRSRAGSSSRASA